MKILSVVLIFTVLLASCTTVEEIESSEDLEVDEVKGTEMTQEEFEELFGKKDFYSYPKSIVEVNADIDPVVLEKIVEKDLVFDAVDNVTIIDEELFEESSLVEETPFVFPLREENDEWVSVPEIETIEMVESVESTLLEEDVSVVPETPTLFLLSQSAEISEEDDKASYDEIITIEI
ncbi:MAG: hypothetical protein MSS69_03140 [Spirochaetales bacterium]|nr:hypothetical protein [Spirochaetales bacterium]